MMSHDVLGRLNELCGAVRARIEATPDFKTLQALERTLAEVKGFMPGEGEGVSESAVEGAPAPEAAADALTAASDVAKDAHASAVEAAEETPEPATASEAASEEAAEGGASEVVAEAAEAETQTQTASADAEPISDTATVCDAGADGEEREVGAEAAVETRTDAAQTEVTDAAPSAETPQEQLVEELAAAIAPEATAPSTATLN